MYSISDLNIFSANIYEDCGNASDVAAYQNIENMVSGEK